MISTKVRAKIVEDNSGVATEIPILLTKQGPISSITDYLLELHLNGASKSSINKVIQSIAMLLEYMDANADSFDDPESMFKAFVRRLYSGTAGDNGIDPSGLYWVPASINTVKVHINRLTLFSDWLADKQSGAQLNPLRKATPHEERLAYAAWWRRKHYDFLGHIKDKSISTTVKRARSIKGRTPLAKTDDDATSFPGTQFERFFIEAIFAHPLEMVKISNG
ncbi:hypothetical protein [Methylomicrobium lacus]|uniref:hypothetical protein n=1 Tax=Methylomicrobium lacus TaxID=136992 RepID=UPI0035A8A07E